MREALSTARPTPLRFAGFLCMTLGALLAGFGATRDWAVVGFPGDAEGALDVPVKGADVWEGKVVLAAAAAILVLMILMRLATSERGRRAAAGAVLLLGIAAAGLAASDAVRPESRFGTSEGLDRVARDVANKLDLPLEDVLAQIEEQFGRQLRVDLGTGLYLSIGGGALGAVGGVLSLAWAKRRRLADGTTETYGVAT